MKKTFLVLCSVALFCLASCSNSKTESNDSADVKKVENTEAAKASDGDETLQLPNSEGLPTVVDFSATWCPPCQEFAPIFHDAEKIYEGKIVFKSIDVDEHREYVDRFGIEAIPLTIYFDAQGKEVARAEGLMTAKEFDQKLSVLLK